MFVGARPLLLAFSWGRLRYLEQLGAPMTGKFIVTGLVIAIIVFVAACDAGDTDATKGMNGTKRVSTADTVSAPSPSNSIKQPEPGLKVQGNEQASTEPATDTRISKPDESGGHSAAGTATTNDDDRTASRERGSDDHEDPGTGQKFMINPNLCRDDYGPQCTALRLGDDYLTTSTPRQGYLYSCIEKNPDAPGSDPDKITWIDLANNTWNFLKKLWLPEGTFQPEVGTYTESISGLSRHITVNNLPLDGMIGDWPMTNYPELTDIDRNPGVPVTRAVELSYPAFPSIATEPTCVSLGAVGVTTNAVVIYSAVDARGEDAVAREIVDVFGGHPARSDYHYHFIPERLDNEELEDGHSGVVGYINDGFPIYGYKGQGGIEMSNGNLDLCHGHDHGVLGYHYHATLEYPYTIGCYRGDPGLNSSTLGQTRGQPRLPPAGRPRR